MYFLRSSDIEVCYDRYYRSIWQSCFRGHGKGTGTRTLQVDTMVEHKNVPTVPISLDPAAITYRVFVSACELLQSLCIASICESSLFLAAGHPRNNEALDCHSLAVELNCIGLGNINKCFAIQKLNDNLTSTTASPSASIMNSGTWTSLTYSGRGFVAG